MALFSQDPVQTLKSLRSLASFANMGLQNPWVSGVLGPAGVGLNAASGNYPQAALSAIQSGAFLADKAGLLGAEAAGAAAGGAATSGALSGGALASLGPTLTASIATAPIAIGLLASSLDDMFTSSDRAQTYKNRANRMKTSATNLSDLRSSAGDITDPVSFKAWLDSPLWEDESTGDVLANIVKKNLAGDWLLGGTDEGSGGMMQWAPHEEYAPLYAGLESMGYGNLGGRDPTNLIGYSGGFSPDKDRFGIPSHVDSRKAVERWDETLRGLSEMFAKINPAWADVEVPMMSKEDATGRVLGAIPDYSPQHLSAINATPGAVSPQWDPYIDYEIQQQGLTQADLDRLYAEYFANSVNPGGVNGA